MTTSEKISVMKASKDGKPIEHNRAGDINWKYVNGVPSWDWTEYDYRVKQSFEFIYPPTTYKADSYGTCEFDIDTNTLNLGIIRATRQQAEASHTRQVQANRFEQLIYQFQDEIDREEDIYSLHYDCDDSRWNLRDATGTYCTIGEIRMTEETAIKVCELLNSGKYKL